MIRLGTYVNLECKYMLFLVQISMQIHTEWFGRRITDGGWVEFDTHTGFPIYGEGSFVIYNRPSNKH
jgi:hypothetical protein